MKADATQEEGAPFTIARRRLLGAALATLAAPPVLAQADWPGERVTIIVSLPAGATTDITTRLYADQLSRFWGHPVVVDNRGGANGVLAAQAVARARPDGRTLLATTAMTHAANPWLIPRLPYDPVGDFDAIAMWSASPFVMMATRGLGTPTLAALTAKLKAEPGRHNYATGTVPGRMVAELYRQLTGVDAVHVGYRGNQAAYPDLTQGRIAFMPVDIQAAKPIVDRGAVVALAVTDAERHYALPDVPSAVEAGLPDFRFLTWAGLYAPKGTPREVLLRIHADMVRAYQTPEVHARILANGGSRTPPTGPDAFQAHTISELAAWGRIIRESGMTLD
jgi:tripartite-type tricarboxylate transporter receptor subunit TctC